MKEGLNNQPFPFVFVDTGDDVIEIHPAPSKSPSIEELFYFLAVMASQGGSVVCHDFLPYMDLDLSDVWKAEEGISVLRRRWELVEKLLKRQCDQREPWLHVRHDLGAGFIELHRADSRWDLPGKMRFRFMPSLLLRR